MTGTTPSDRSHRWRVLLGLLSERGTLSVADAAEQLGVSAATIRRDFTSLERQQLATRTHGGVVATSVAYELPSRYRYAGDGHPKERVAATAAVYVEPGTVVGFNGGTTTTAVARHLAARSDLMAPGDDDAVTLVTNALNIAGEMVLRPHMRTLCIGGVARRESYELYGPYASRFLADLHLDLLFLGVNAITATGGAMCRHYGEAGINAEMVARANRVIAVATAEKLTATALSRICPVSAIDILVTDASADRSAVADLEAAGVEVQLA